MQPGLFIGSIGAARNPEALRRAGITHVLSLLGHDSMHWVTWGGEKGRHMHSHEHLCMDINDDKSADVLAVLPRCVTFIQEGLQAGRGVLVHCFQGKSRSAAVIMGFLMHSEGLSFEGALARIRAARPRAQPNLSFCLQLRRWERRREEGKTKPAAASGHGDGSGV